MKKSNDFIAMSKFFRTFATDLWWPFFALNGQSYYQLKWVLHKCMMKNILCLHWRIIIVNWRKSWRDKLRCILFCCLFLRYIFLDWPYVHFLLNPASRLTGLCLDLSACLPCSFSFKASSCKKNVIHCSFLECWLFFYCVFNWDIENLVYPDHNPPLM